MLAIGIGSRSGVEVSFCNSFLVIFADGCVFSGQWSLGKCYDGWAPWGPAVVTKKGLPGGSLNGLRISTTVNGHVKQNELLDDMVFGVAYTVSFLSQGVTLLPGDLIFTGTPAGVQLGQHPPVWLTDGDEIKVAVDGIGGICNRMEFIKDKGN